MDDVKDKKQMLRKPSYDRVMCAVAVTVVLMVLCGIVINIYVNAYGEKKEYYLTGSSSEKQEIYENPYIGKGLVVVGDRIDILEFTDTVAQGEYATVRIQGEPSAKYSITVYLKSGPSKNTALVEKEANGYGVVEWSWKISNNTSTGDVRVVIRRMDGENNCITYAEAVLVVTPKSDQ